MKTHTSRTAQFYQSSSQQQEKQSGRKGEKQTPPGYGMDFADQQLQPIQAVMEAGQPAAPAMLAPPNNTGLPDQLKARVESFSGYSMDDVKVHYNSSKPAQINAHAYAQGTDIHLGPGQERHLPHEAWHVVQQKEGRVRANTKILNMDVNIDESLESEAGQFTQIIHHRSAALTSAPFQNKTVSKPVVQGYWYDTQTLNIKDSEDIIGKLEKKGYGELVSRLRQDYPPGSTYGFDIRLYLLNMNVNRDHIIEILGEPPVVENSEGSANQDSLNINPSILYAPDDPRRVEYEREKEAERLRIREESKEQMARNKKEEELRQQEEQAERQREEQEWRQSHSADLLDLIEKIQAKAKGLSESCCQDQRLRKVKALLDGEKEIKAFVLDSTGPISKLETSDFKSSKEISLQKIWERTWVHLYSKCDEQLTETGLGKPKIKELKQLDQGKDWDENGFLAKDSPEEWLCSGLMGGCLSVFILEGPQDQAGQYSMIRGFHGGGGPTDELMAFTRRHSPNANKIIIAHAGDVGGDSQIDSFAGLYKGIFLENFLRIRESIIWVNKKGEVRTRENRPDGTPYAPIAEPVLQGLQELQGQNYGTGENTGYW